MTAGFRERVSSGVSPGLQQGFSAADICIFLCFEGNMFSGEEGMQEIVNKLLTIWISALFFQLYADFIILPQVAAKSEKHGTVCAAAVRRPGERERRQEPYFSLVRGAGRLFSAGARRRALPVSRGCSLPLRWDYNISQFIFTQCHSSNINLVRRLSDLPIPAFCVAARPCQVVSVRIRPPKLVKDYG